MSFIDPAFVAYRKLTAGRQEQSLNSVFNKMAGLPHRITKKTQRLLAEPVPGIKIEQDESNALYFHAVIGGSQDSLFEGGTSKLELLPPEEYPKEAPKWKYKFIIPM